MLKVYLDAGLEDRLETVIGEYVTEDERYLILGDTTIRRKIPHRRIVHMEDLSEAIAAKPIIQNSRPVEMAVQPKPISKPPVPGQKPLSLAELRKSLREGRREGKIPELTVEEQEQVMGKTFVNVIVTGADDKTISLEIPESSFTPNEYNASLAKELSKNEEIKSLLDKGIVFDGPPSVVGKNIYVKTKTLSEKVSGVGDKMELVSALHKAGNRFMQPEKNYQTDFSMTAKTDLNGIPHNPFDGPVLIDDLKPPVSSEIVVEGDPKVSQEAVGEINEDSVEEGRVSEEGTGKEAPEGNEGILEKSTSD